MLTTKINASAIKAALAGKCGVVPSINDGNVRFKMAEKDSEGNPLEPGVAYCKCTMYENECDAIRFGCLVRYGSDGKFYNINYYEVDFMEDESDYEFLVRQNLGVDSKYIFNN